MQSNDKYADLFAAPPHKRGLFCNRTLNLRSIRAIGYDMDYTLIHYRVEAWERRAYEHIQKRLGAQGLPTAGLSFDPGLIIRGLIIDTELGNIVKANRFGYVKRAFHGTRLLEFDEMRRVYERTIVDLANPRWFFINTFFSLSEACLYAQLVNLLDEQRITGTMGYADLFRCVRENVDETHMEGTLKAEIIGDPDHFIEIDPELPLALMDQRAAGKKILLITNSEWYYTNAMMNYAVNRFMPDGKTWRDLFDFVLVGARKPDFFSINLPLFEVVEDSGQLRPWVGGLREGGCYWGGHASLLEKSLGIGGDEILYVGDHIYGDVKVSKSLLRWRTALIVREMEDEIDQNEAHFEDSGRIASMMKEKEALEHQYARLKLAAQRLRGRYGPPCPLSDEEIQARMLSLRDEITKLDDRIAPLAKAAAVAGNARWGLLMRAGNDKSHLARQIERSADLYTSRVSNFLHYTPFAFLRSVRGTLPHDV